MCGTNHALMSPVFENNICQSIFTFQSSSSVGRVCVVNHQPDVIPANISLLITATITLAIWLQNSEKKFKNSSVYNLNHQLLSIFISYLFQGLQTPQCLHLPGETSRCRHAPASELKVEWLQAMDRCDLARGSALWPCQHSRHTFLMAA